MQKAKAEKKKFTPRDLIGDDYVDRITALSDRADMERQAEDYYRSMWRACSSGSRYMISGALSLIPIPFVLFFYSADFGGLYEFGGFLSVVIAIGFVYQGGLRVLSYFRNRERLLDLLQEEPVRQAKLPEFEEE